jgi:hypothetical protein
MATPKNTTWSEFKSNPDLLVFVGYVLLGLLALELVQTFIALTETMAGK